MKLSYLSILPTLIQNAQAGDVVALGDSDFDSTMKNTDLALVKFYAPWCGHCKKIAPEFEKAALALKENDPPVLLADVDCTVHDSVCGQNDVSGYPTLKVFRNGVASEYNGGRTAGEMIKIMMGQAGPASKELKDAEKLEKYQNLKSVVVLGFFESENDSKAKNFQKIANEFRDDIKFGHCYDAELAKQAGDYKIGDIVLLRPKIMKSKFEDQAVKYSKDKFTVGLLRSFIKENKNGLAPVITPDSLPELAFPAVISLYNVDYEKDPKGSGYWRNRIMKVAQNFPENSYGIGSHGDWASVATEIGLEPNGPAPLVVAFTDPKTKYVMSETFDPKGEAFTKFLTDFKAGNLEKHLKSEGEQDNEGKANKVLTARNFESLVDGSKDAFVEFYAPWCGHCKSLAPQWEAMAEQLQEGGNEENIVVGKFDATANDVPEQFEVQGFPTIYWVPKGQLNSPVKYQGGRSTEDLVKYAKENASGDIKLKDEL